MSLVPKYIVDNDAPTRKIVTHKQRLERFKKNEDNVATLVSDDLCRNCLSTEVVASPADGDLICGECGVVRETPVYYELHPFFWNSRGDDVFECPDSGVAGSSKFGNFHGGSTYVRYFHFNEILASITLKGPWIPTTDMRILREELSDRGIGKPTKQDIQLVCKAINKRYGIRRFSQKYSEKWIQVINRYNGDRPVQFSNELVQSLRSAFRLLSNCWEEVSELLTGSKDPQRRIQWPNYSETLYRIIKRKHPDLLPHIKRWIPRLSRKKRQDLRPFFKRLFYLVGWRV